TLGLNVEFARLATDASRRERLGQLTYAASTLESLTKLQPVPVTLHLHEVSVLASAGGAETVRHELTLTYNALQLAVVNTPVFGGALNLRVPGVSANDRLLDFLVIEAPEPALLRGVAEALVAAFARLGEMASGTWLGLADEDVAEATAISGGAAESVWPGVHRIQARSGRIETPTAVEITLDGEIRGHTPFEVAIAQRPVRVLLPREAHPTLAPATAAKGTDNSAARV